LEQASRVLEAQLLKYFESEIKSLMEIEITRERVTNSSTWDIASDGNDVCTFEIAATILIYLISLFIYLNSFA
jgi:hypothetical protein